jgi:predicted DNA binding CopG/RHH family protein
MKKLKKIPKFKSIAEKEQFWATHDSTEYVDYTKVESAFFSELKPSNKIISIRLPESIIEAIKLLANKQDIPYQLMLKILLSEKIREVFNVKPRRKKATISLPSLDEFRSTIKVTGEPLSKAVIAARKKERH